jgi:hypothetical protein
MAFAAWVLGCQKTLLCWMLFASFSDAKCVLQTRAVFAKPPGGFYALLIGSWYYSTKAYVRLKAGLLVKAQMQWRPSRKGDCGGRHWESAPRDIRVRLPGVLKSKFAIDS